MEEIVLNAKKRTVIGKQVKALRREGKMPAVIYGRSFDPVVISLDAHKATKLLVGFSMSQLLVIDVDGGKLPELIKMEI